MRTSKQLAIGLALVVTAGIFAAPAFGAEISLGQHSQGEIKDACNAVGGQLLGVSDSGSYGCENANKGTMILCNKDQQCTGYVPATTPATRKRILDSFHLTMKAAVKQP